MSEKDAKASRRARDAFDVFKDMTRDEAKAFIDRVGNWRLPTKAEIDVYYDSLPQESTAPGKSAGPG